jgi:hypothetical protein
MMSANEELIHESVDAFKQRDLKLYWPKMIEPANQSLVADRSFALASLALGRHPKRAIGRALQPRTISMVVVGHLFP